MNELTETAGVKRKEFCFQRIVFRNCRKSKGLTIKQLADYFGVTETTIRNIESGRARVLKQDFMVNAAIFFDCNIFELFPESPLLKHVLEQFKITKISKT